MNNSHHDIITKASLCVNMSSSGSTLRAPRKMNPSAAEAMKLRLEKNNLSELGVNWNGKSHLNAIESDTSYKYHLVGMPCVDFPVPM